MVTWKQVLVLSILSHVIFTKEQFKTHFIGCYECGSYIDQGWKEYKLLTTDIFRECKTRAKNESWKVFGVNKDPLCFGSVNSFKLLKDAEKPKAECPNKELNGVSAAIGNSGRLAVHHIVEYKTVALQKESDEKIECEDDHVFVLSEALLSGPESNCVSEDETKNITSSALNWCKGSRDCTVDSNDIKEGGCSYSQIDITYGCLIDIDGGANEKTPYQRQYRGDSTYGGTNDGEDHYSPVAVILFVFTGLIQFACIFCACLRKFSNNQSHTANNPAHTSNNPAQTANNPAYTANNPAQTANYPAHTANNPAHTANYPAYTANNPAHTANNPAHTANNPAQTANYPAHTANNPAYTANCPAHTANYPAHTANYPAHTANNPAQTENNPAHTAAPGFSSNVPAYIPGNIPPPSYDDVTASNTGGRGPTSGGWFNKM